MYEIGQNQSLKAAFLAGKAQHPVAMATIVHSNQKPIIILIICYIEQTSNVKCISKKVFGHTFADLVDSYRESMLNICFILLLLLFHHSLTPAKCILHFLCNIIVNAPSCATCNMSLLTIALKTANTSVT